MALAIIKSPMSFFETTPTGRILNRFSKYVSPKLSSLAPIFLCIFPAIFTLFIISAGTPLFMILIIPLLGLYLYMQRYYLRTKRILKRLDSVSRSPIYAHFQESLGGVATIRAFGQQERFDLKHERHVDANLRAYIPSINANRWLGVRLEFIGSVVILSAAGFAVHGVSTGSSLSSAMVGLTMSYALQITQSLNSLVRLSGEVETNILSVERVLEYTKLPSEAPDIIHAYRPAAIWPAYGAVQYLDYSARYRQELDMVLKHINLDIQPGEKIGVVGRTGAGKSSLALSLFRIMEPAEGSINIDNVDTSSIGLLDLREKLTIIPQDAALFEGTIRSNLDPTVVHDDTELWNALVAALTQLAGSNLSQGQKQLVSLARAMLRPSPILVLDEATAAVDIETDKLLHKTLHTKFFDNRTVITIAHRISSIIHSDRIVVLAQGEVAECDTPAALMARKGLFYELVKEAGLQINEA
ncbi:P-loop containing nucleoside triphosphate hydrolase protein [Aspergillus bertholletiae]|uniref:P-loop containing nucleoside triphosphate hydrolase protein n=1 Tax=Aspergillus bertholletiae TaxID=1226010 RepID=A0A5N7B0U8_9EURO|nr:P-loop containing nucleoside triphosphate hydrolase protein [Aspergillus bertholletiae]